MSRIMITTVAVAALAGLAQAELAYAVTQNQTLISFDTASPNALESGLSITGLMSNEQIHGIDFRPATGELYGLGSMNNLYRIDTATGAATRVGNGAGIVLNGSSFGFDFNPVIDRIRVVSDTNNNYVFNPDSGTASQVTNLFYNTGDVNFGANPNVVGSAYTNSFAGAATTQLYGIDTGLDILVTQANSAGTLQTVGSLGGDITDLVGFDISGLTGMAFAMTVDAGTARSTLWSINLTTGQATALSEIGGGAVITSFAIVPAPGVAVLAMPLALAGLRRRR